MATKTYVMKVPIGDWSEDGHGECDWYTVEVDRPLQEMFKLHFDASKKIGFDLGEMCPKYEEGRLTKDQMNLLNVVGICKLLKVPEDNSPSGLATELNEDLDYPEDTEELLNLWFTAFKLYDPTFEYKIVPDDNIPKFYNWSYKKIEGYSSYFRGPGYGMFS